VDFDPDRTMFVDDSLPVLQSAATYGVKHPVVIARPDTSRPRRNESEFVSVEGLSELL
jgi:putative hydrolase of the HAD superfamily